jgi:beta-glucosidase
MGRTFTLALQNDTNGFIQVASMSRHFLGFHGATDLPNSGEEWVSPQWLADQHLPAYRSLMVDGNAEAVMCSCNTLRVGPGDGSAGGIPACVHPLLYDVLRNRWNSSALVQADNEAIFPMWQDHHYFKTLEDAVVGALKAGVYAVDSGGGAAIVAALSDALGNGTVSMAQVDAMVQRQFEMRLRVGEFDTDNPRNPFRGPHDAAQLDGPAHRALAREAVQKGATLLRNEAPPGAAGGRRLLPLAAAPPATIAVIGPWADAGSTRGDYGCYTPSYFGNYAATTSVTSTILAALREEFGASANISYALGADPYDAASPTGIADAAALAGASQLTVLVLGLGCGIEAEGRDRPFLYLPAVQDALLAAVSGAVRRGGGALLLVTVSANVIDLDAALADAWVQLFLPGEEAGHGFVDVAVGRVSPSGRLPLTGYANEYLDVAGPTADFNMVSATTGVGRTYRFADRIPAGLVKLPFGFGLSYSSFQYGALAVAYAPGASAVNVTFTVANVGSFSPAREVVQLYIRVPSVPGLVTPTLQLRSFTAVTLSAGDAPTQVSLPLPFPGAFTTTLVDGSYMVTGGSYAVFVGGGQPVPSGSPNGNVLMGSVTLPPMTAGEF